jgi:hypothetical protein
MKSFMLTALFSVIAIPAVADSYQSQTDLNYGWVDVGNVDLNAWEAKQRFFLAPVSTDGAVPLAEAAFMQRQSSLAATFTRLTVDGPGIDAHNNAWSMGGEYMDRSHNYYASLDMEFVNNSKEYEATTKLGYFVQNDWLVTADIYHIKDDLGRTALEYGVSTKKLLDLNTGDFMAINASFRNQDDSSITAYEVGADYYFGKNLSVGLGYHWVSTGVFQSDEDGFEVRSNWYVLPNLALNASVGRMFLDDVSLEETSYQLGASYRF